MISVSKKELKKLYKRATAFHEKEADICIEKALWYLTHTPEQPVEVSINIWCGICSTHFNSIEDFNKRHIK